MTDKYQQGTANELTRKRGAANLLGRQEEGSAKKPYSLPGKEPDVIVVVGDTEFYEHSKDLRAWSDYFDTAIMKETCQRRFEFPHRSPTEWQYIKELAAPFATKKIDGNSFDFAISWFDELCCGSGMKACDKFIISELLEYHFPREKDIPYDCDEKVETLFGIWSDFCCTYSQHHLPMTKTKCLHYFCHMLTHAPFLFSSRYLWERMIGFLQLEDDLECQQKLWQALKKNLPASALKLGTKEELLENDLLPEVLMLNQEVRAIEAGYLRIRGLMFYKKSPMFDPAKVDWKHWITSMAKSQMDLYEDSQWVKLDKYLPEFIFDMTRDELLNNCLLNDLLILASTKMQYLEQPESFLYSRIDNKGEWGRFLTSIQDNTYDGCVHRSSSACPACRPALSPESQN